jgi:hypothetical protein
VPVRGPVRGRLRAGSVVEDDVSLLRAFTDIDQARPVHRWIVGAALLVGFVLLGLVPE